MTSDITDPKQEWLDRKARVGQKLGDIVAFTRQTLKELLPDIRAIKDGRLYEHGGYESFKDFCIKCLNVTSRRLYQLITEDDARKVLEISTTERNNFTPADPEPPSKMPTKKAKARKTITVEATVLPRETKWQNLEKRVDAMKATIEAEQSPSPRRQQEAERMIQALALWTEEERAMFRRAFNEAYPEGGAR